MSASLSIASARTPLRASRRASVAPVGPAPTIRTSHSRALAITLCHRHHRFDGAQLIDFAADLVSGFEKPTRIHCSADAAWRAGEDQIAGFERHRLREMFDLIPDV